MNDPRLDMTRTIGRLLLRKDFRDAVNTTTLPTGEHVIIPLLPTDPISELLDQATAAGGPIHAVIENNRQLHAIAVTITWTGKNDE